MEFRLEADKDNANYLKKETIKKKRQMTKGKFKVDISTNAG